MPLTRARVGGRLTWAGDWAPIAEAEPGECEEAVDLLSSGGVVGVSVRGRGRGNGCGGGGGGVGGGGGARERESERERTLE